MRNGTINKFMRVPHVIIKNMAKKGYVKLADKTAQAKYGLKID